MTAKLESSTLRFALMTMPMERLAGFGSPMLLTAGTAVALEQVVRDGHVVGGAGGEEHPGAGLSDVRRDCSR